MRRKVDLAVKGQGDAAVGYPDQVAKREVFKWHKGVAIGNTNGKRGLHSPHRLQRQDRGIDVDDFERQLALKQGKPVWLLLPAAASLALFAWLLTLHDTAGAGRVYAAYGGVYIGVALAWLWAVDGIRPTAWDVAGVLVALAGMAIIVLQPEY